jgi:hypothetical protein
MAAMSPETPARHAPGGSLDIAHSGVGMGAADPMQSSAPGETAVEMDQTKHTVLSADVQWARWKKGAPSLISNTTHMDALQPMYLTKESV